MAATHFSGPVVSLAGFVGPLLGPTEDPAAAGGSTQAVGRRPAIADSAPTTMITITVPNGIHAAGIFLDILAHLDNGGSARVATGSIVVVRQAGVAAVAVASALAGATIATVAAGGTFTLALTVNAVQGANNSTQTFTVSATMVGTPAGAATVMMNARVMNSNGGGITVSAT